MRPSRRDLLRLTGLAGAGGLAGCVGRILPGEESAPPDYLAWLTRPGRMVTPTEYRVGVVRPAAVTDAGTRLAPFLPTDLVAPIDPTESERVIAGEGVTILTTTVERSTIVDAYRDEGYTYNRGIGEFWILDDDDGETPVVAVGPETLVVARPTVRESANGVVDTVLYGRQAEDRWTSTSQGLEAFTERLGTPPALVLDLAPPEGTTNPRQGRFAGVGKRAISHRFEAPRRTYALHFEGSPEVEAVRTWRDVALDDLQHPETSTDGRVMTVSGRPRDPDRVRTTLPAVDRVWNGHGADPRRSATLPDAAQPRAPVRERWTFSPPEGIDIPQETDGSQSTPWVIRTGDLPFDPPTVSDGTVFVTAQDCFALDSRDGRMLWRAGLEGARGTPVLADGTLYTVATVDDRAAVVALDAATGRTRWRWHPPDGLITTLVSSGGRLIAGTRSPYLRGDGEAPETPPDMGPFGLFALEDGTERWRWTGLGVGSAAGTPETIVAAGGGTAPEVVAVGTADGTQLWRHPVETQLTPLIAMRGNRIVATGREAVVGLDASDGTGRWRHAPGYETRFTRAALTADLAYVGTARPPSSIRPEEDGGTLWGLDLGDGTVRVKTGLTRRVTARPAVAGDGLYVVTGGGAFSRFDRDGRETWTLYLAGRLGTPTVVGGTVYLPTGAGPLAALGTDWLPGDPPMLISARS